MLIKPRLIKPQKIKTTSHANHTHNLIDAPIEEQPEAPNGNTSSPLSDNFIKATTDSTKKAKEVPIDNVIENM